jgi:ferredoxin--NADP+ reductase
MDRLEPTGKGRDAAPGAACGWQNQVPGVRGWKPDQPWANDAAHTLQSPPMSRTEETTTGPVLQPVKMHLHMPANPAEAVCVSNERCTQRKAAHFVRHIAFDVSGTQLAGVLRPGQAFGVLPPGVDANGRPHKLRLYSVASPTRGEDGQGNIIATTVKRTIDEHYDHHRLFLGVASNYLCDLQVGDKVLLTGPSGKRFVLPQNPGEHDYIFFATGTGIAPFRAMLLDLLADGAASNSRLVLVMGAAYATDLLYHGDLLKLQLEHPNFTYLTAISRERQEDGHDPLYVQDRVQTHRDLLLPMLESERTLVYICGLAGMELGIFQRLTEILPDHALEQYLRVDSSLASDIRIWERSMINRQIRPTRRVFLEVY